MLGGLVGGGVVAYRLFGEEPVPIVLAAIAGAWIASVTYKLLIAAAAIALVAAVVLNDERAGPTATSRSASESLARSPTTPPSLFRRRIPSPPHSKPSDHYHQTKKGGSWTVDPGYEWLNDEPGDFRVIWVPGERHPANKNVVASDTEDNWKPAPGFKWAKPDDPDNLRTVPKDR